MENISETSSHLKEDIYRCEYLRKIDMLGISDDAVRAQLWIKGVPW